MRVWRICKKEHASSAFSGIGAEKTGGRWNHQGHKMVYTASSLSLACLELFVHLEPYLLPGDLISVSAEIPDSVTVERFAVRDLPSDWRDYPAPFSTQNLGTRWLEEQRSFVLAVPSAVNPEEVNLLLNPLHSGIAFLNKIETKPFQFDPRMWKKP